MISKPRTKSRIRRVLTVFAGILAGLLLVSAVVIFGTYGYVALRGNAHTSTLDDLPRDVDCIIVPGCQVYADGSPSPMLQDRLEGAVMLYEAGVSDRILVSGDHREDNYNEPGAMRRYLLRRGIPDEAIFMDHYGLCTYDTMYRARHVFQVRRAVVATQRFHLQRALYIGLGQGMDVRGFATDPRRYMSEIYMFVRELGARMKAAYQLHLGEAPTRMSPVCPISGDGRTTHDAF
ncbi:MAG: SanA/YdcF family protein [Saccharofermentanales bacterium]|jgi:SanA protein